MEYKPYFNEKIKLSFKYRYKEATRVWIEKILCRKKKNSLSIPRSVNN